jgi:hypothetical protein
VPSAVLRPTALKVVRGNAPASASPGQASCGHFVSPRQYPSLPARSGTKVARAPAPLGSQVMSRDHGNEAGAGLTEVRGSGARFGPPKSRAGKRVVPIPEVIARVVQWHLSCFAEDGDEDLIFTSPEGRPLHHSNFRRRVCCLRSLRRGSPIFTSTI